MNWTDSQRSAIEARGQNVLVNAGAGAGKTAVLVERVFHLLTDAESPVPLDSMLIVTFTRAAAGEMRHRLAEKLRAELAQALDTNAPDERIRLLQSQLVLLPRAPISTLDSFCLRLLRDYSEAIGLPPDFELMAEDEAELLRREMIEAAIEETFDHPKHGPALTSVLGQISPIMGLELVAQTVRRLHSFLDSLADPDAFVARAIGELEEAADASRPFDATAIGVKLRAHVERPIRDALAAYGDFFRAMRESDLTLNWTKKYFREASECRAVLQQTLDSLTPDAPLPDLASALKCPRRSGIGKSPSAGDIALHAAGVPLKAALERAAATFEDWEPGIRLDDLRAEAAATLPFARLFLQHLGLDLIRKLLERHLELRRLTFAHLERLALKTLVQPDGEPSEIAHRLRGEFEHVLVDEFQDVNELQGQLLRAVARPSGEGIAANLFVVGDVKQSIYGFRQADPRQFQRLYDSFSDHRANTIATPGGRIDLAENFRSTPPLLDEINLFFTRLFGRRIGQLDYDERHAFRAGRAPSEDTKPCLQILLLEGEEEGAHVNESGVGEETAESNGDGLEVLEADEREARFVARLIRAEGWRFGDVAVLVRTGRGYATKLVEAFQEEGIPYNTQESIGFLAQQEVRDVLTLLRTIDNPYREVALIGCLRGPAAEWDENDLARLRLRDRNGRLFENLKAHAQDNGSPLRDKAAAFLERLRRWQHAIQRESMGVFFGHLYEELWLRERVSTLPNGDQRLRNLEHLHERALQFDSFRRKGLAPFLEFLDDLLEREQDLGTPPPAAPDANVVRLMTIHKSKGLQFPVVILPFLGKRFNLRDARAEMLWDASAGFGAGFRMGRGYGGERFAITRDLLVQPIEDRLRSEELRLLYVAMTRAQDRLILMGTMKDAMARAVEWQGRHSANAAEREERSARAGAFLDWVMLGTCHRGEFEALARDGMGRGDALEMRLAHEEAAPSRAEETQSTKDALAKLRAALPELKVLFERVAESTVPAEAFALRAKISATEAKRAYESLHTEESPAAELVPRRKRRAPEQPAWWPESLAASGPISGRRRGTLAHRLCALVDLDAIASGETVENELERLTAAGYFSEREAQLIDTGRLQTFFDQPGLGERLLAARATARREVPFTVRIDAREMGVEDESAGFLVFQGIVDLLFEEPVFDKSTGTWARQRLILVDFKTDYWDGTGSAMERLEEAYAPQVELYRIGLEKALGRAVDESWLYFLSAQAPVLLQAGGAAGRWVEWLQAACVRGTGPGGRG